MEWNLAIAGVSYTNEDGSSRQAAALALSPGEKLTLAPEPGNRFDPNAVRVCNARGTQLGYVPRHAASEISELISRGHQLQAVVTRCVGGGELLTGVRFRVTEGDVLTSKKENDS